MIQNVTTLINAHHLQGAVNITIAAGGTDAAALTCGCADVTLEVCAGMCNWSGPLGIGDDANNGCLLFYLISAGLSRTKASWVECPFKSIAYSVLLW